MQCDVWAYNDTTGSDKPVFMTTPLLKFRLPSALSQVKEVSNRGGAVTHAFPGFATGAAVVALGARPLAARMRSRVARV